MIKKTILLFLLMLILSSLKAQHIALLQKGKPTSIRGMSVVDDKVAWISGSKGYVALTKDGGKSWSWLQVKGYEKADFRSIVACSDKKAVIMSSGTPALILKTIDGGISWQLKYKNTDTAYFFDAMDFAGKKHGIVLGDPITGKFLLFETNDEGESWHQMVSSPEAMPGEAAFAASGTCLRITNQSISIVTGGQVARHIYGNYPCKIWNDDYLPIVYGKPSQGAFSMDTSAMVFVGGDYSDDKNKNGVACWYNPARVSIKNGWDSGTGMSGYQSCVEQIGEHTHLSTGTSGTNISDDLGKTWTTIDTASYNVCRKARHGALVLLAGNNGAIGIFQP